jgi:FixJ family two-component response regulator
LKDRVTTKDENTPRNSVELGPRDSNILWRDDDDPAISLERGEERRIAIERIEAIRSRLSTREAIVFDLICQGVHDTESFAEALAIAHLGDQERRTYVKLFKDRLMRKLKRMNGSSS